MVARIGGEEFAVAAVVDSTQQGYLLAEKIRHGVESQAFGWGHNPIHLTISMGLETREVGQPVLPSCLTSCCWRRTMKWSKPNRQAVTASVCRR